MNTPAAIEPLLEKDLEANDRPTITREELESLMANASNWMGPPRGKHHAARAQRAMARRNKKRR